VSALSPGATRRVRAAALIGTALACGGLAASLVNGYASDVRAQVGPLVPVVVARSTIPPGRVLTPANVDSFLRGRRVPARFAPPDAMRAMREAIGLRPLLPIAAGGYASEPAFAPPARHTATEAASGARVVEVTVAGAGSLTQLVHPGTPVDVLVTSERGTEAPRTYVALQRVELLDLRSGDGEAGGRGGDAIATLRVGLRQAVMLVAAQNFARELRLVPRGQGDRRPVGPMAVAADDLRP